MKNIKKIIWWILVIAVMAVIFSFSSEKAVDSSDTSKRFIRVLLDILPFTKDLLESAKLELIASMDFMIRKCAHFTLYAMLGFVTFGAVKSTFGKVVKLNIIYSLIVSVLYAVSDEIHQYFVPGRACRIYDVSIDTLGCVFGISLFVLLGFNVRKFNKNKVKC